MPNATEYPPRIPRAATTPRLVSAVEPAPSDPDESPVALAEAIDAVLDEIAEALAAGDVASAIALVTAAEVVADTLLELLGGTDEDDAE